MNFEAFNCLLISLQSMFNTYWFGMVQHGEERSNGLLMFLFSTQNRRGLEVLNDTLQDRNGIRRKVTLRNRKNLCLKLACADWECDTPVQTYIVTPEATEIVLSAGPCYLFSPESPVVPMVPSWDPDEFKDLCVNQPEMLANTIAEYVANLEYELEKKYLGDFRTNIIPATCDADGAPRPSVALFMPHADTPQSPYANPLVYNTIDEQSRKTFTSGGYGIIGGTRMKAYMDRREIRNGGSFANGNSTLPVNDGRSQWRFYYSWAFDEVFEEESFVTIRDGVVHILQWSENKGYKSQLSEDTVRWSSFRSMSGLLYDMDWSKEITGTARKCVKVSYAIRHTGELYVAPGGGCDVNDCYNGVLWWRDCGLNPWFMCDHTEPINCDNNSASYTEARYFNYSSRFNPDFTGAEIKLAGKSYIANPVISDPVLASAEIEVLLQQDYPFSTIIYDVLTSTLTVSCIPSQVAFSSSLNANTKLGLISENHVAVLTPTGADAAIITVAGIELFNGPIVNQGLTNGVTIKDGLIYLVQGNSQLGVPVVATFSANSCPDFNLSFDWNPIIVALKKEGNSFFELAADSDANHGGVYNKKSKATTWTEEAIITALATHSDYPMKYSDGSKIVHSNAYISSFEIGLPRYEQSDENSLKTAGAQLIDNGPPIILNGTEKIVRKKGVGTNWALTLPLGMKISVGLTISQKISV